MYNHKGSRGPGGLISISVGPKVTSEHGTTESREGKVTLLK